MKGLLLSLPLMFCIKNKVEERRNNGGARLLLL